MFTGRTKILPLPYIDICIYSTKVVSVEISVISKSYEKAKIDGYMTKTGTAHTMIYLTESP